ncbi:MAG: hypothetical protein OXG15_08855 [Gammaproteobacteria bacterium]|nr:hypothetical protein [Gammaproteobacteria bacterium]
MTIRLSRRPVRPESRSTRRRASRRLAYLAYLAICILPVANANDDCNELRAEMQATAAEELSPCDANAIWCDDMSPGSRDCPALIGWSSIVAYFNGDTLGSNSFDYEDGTYVLSEVSLDGDATLRLAFSDTSTDALENPEVRARQELLVDRGEGVHRFKLGEAMFSHEGGEYVFLWRSSGLSWSVADTVRLQFEEIPRGAFRPVITSESNDLIDTTFVVSIDFGFRRVVDAFPNNALRVTNGAAEAPRKTWGPNGEPADGRFWEATVWPTHLRYGPVEYGRHQTHTLTVDIAAGIAIDTGSDSEIVRNLAAETYTREIFDGDLCNGDPMGCTEPPNRDRLCIVHNGSGCLEPSLGPFTGPLAVELWFVRDHILVAQVQGFTLDDVWVPNGSVTKLQSKYGDNSDFLITVTPDPNYSGPFTVRVPDSAAHACETEDLTNCDSNRPTRGDSLTLSVVATGM